MDRPTIETIEVVTPTGYTIVLKKRLTYGDQQRVNNDIMGDMEVGGDASDVKLKFKQAIETSPVKIFYHIASWDITDNGKELPITLENLKSSLFEEDVNFLMKEIDRFKPDPKKEIRS